MSQQTPDTFLYRGTSMWPCFQEGDLLEIAPLAGSQTILRGDCLVWRDDQGRYVVHRVVGRNGETRGDGLMHNDLAGPSGAILGRVVRRHRFGKGSTVWGGSLGSVAGVFYRYAGRIDPERNARGGRLARGFRKVTAPLLRHFLKRECQLGGVGQTQLYLWKLGGVTLAVGDPTGGAARVAWPWRLFVIVPAE